MSRTLMRWRRLSAGGALCLTALLLTACGSDLPELQTWMERQRQEVRPSVEPLAPPTKFTPVPYASQDAADPFSLQKLSVALKQDARQPSSVFAAEFKRRKEPLEAFPLDAMTMVGSVAKGSTPRALLRVDNLLYQVKPGDHIGQNYGRITRITETEISLREIVQDAVGEWIERTTTLQLQEKAP